MCCDGTFCFCMSVRTGSLIFAWINAVLFGLGTLACFIINMISIGYLLQVGRYGYETYVSLYILTNAILVYSAAGLTASVLLLIGIIQRKPVLIKGYIIYGMIITLLMIIVFIIVECMTYYNVIIVRIAEVLGCCIYCSVLYLHYFTFKNTVSTTNGYVVPPAQV